MANEHGKLCENDTTWDDLFIEYNKEYNCFSVIFKDGYKKHRLKIFMLHLLIILKKLLHCTIDWSNYIDIK